MIHKKKKKHYRNSFFMDKIWNALNTAKKYRNLEISKISSS